MHNYFEVDGNNLVIKAIIFSVDLVFIPFSDLMILWLLSPNHYEECWKMQRIFYLDEKNSLKIICNGLKIVWKNNVRMIWFYEFWGSMNC